MTECQKGAIMTKLDIAHQRLYNQYIAPATFENPGNAVEADIEQAMADGVIVRTHPMRGTWHFVAPEDIRWLLTLTAPGRIASNALWYRRLELDEATFAKSNAVFAQTLQGGKQLTRRELAAALGQAGISTEDLRLPFILSRAELEGVIGSGARRGKQFTFALLDEVVPVSRSLERDEALAELASRYFTSHGPATVQDFIWWSGLTAADGRAGLEMVKSEFIQEVIEGKTYWLSPSTPTAKVVSPVAYLLPPFDEYTVAYKDRRAVLDPAYAQQAGYGIGPTIVVDGQIVGTWKRTFNKDAVVITSDLFTSVSEAQNRAIAAAVERYSRFVGKSITKV